MGAFGMPVQRAFRDRPSRRGLGLAVVTAPRWPVHHSEIPTMKIKTTATTTKKARASKAAAKVKRRSVPQGRLSRTGRSPAASMADTPNAPPTNDRRSTSKKATIEALVRRKGGAAIADLMAATGWQEHSIRAALTGLRKTGHTISRERDDGGATHYRIAEVV